jgi:hypothetical protein
MKKLVEEIITIEDKKYLHLTTKIFKKNIFPYLLEEGLPLMVADTIIKEINKKKNEYKTTFYDPDLNKSLICYQFSYKKYTLDVLYLIKED